MFFYKNKLKHRTMQESTEPNTETIKIHEIIYNEESTINFLLTNNILKQRISCDGCVTVSMVIRKDNSAFNGFCFKCENVGCRKRKNIYMGLKHKISKIKLSKVIHCAYLYSLRLFNFQICILVDIAENTFLKLKKVFKNSLKQSCSENEKLGGPGFVLQIDETACNRRRLITSPTTENEYVRGTKWVIGIICERTKKVRLDVLEDRSIRI
jgi:hypothetical protein